ncbi:MAG: hypothetical protein QM731_18210 [Chitinophagaceae bacterium]
MAPIQFAFEQNQLTSYFVNNSFDKLVISLCPVKMPGETHSYMYACGQAYTAANTVVPDTIITLACPNPPGWKDCDGAGNTSLVTAQQLANTPKFSLSKEDLGIILGKNKYKKGNRAQVLIQLEGENTEEGLETFINVVALDDDGKNVKSTLATAFQEATSGAQLKTA